MPYYWTVAVNIVLIGLSGSGKSTVGKLLARLLDWEFVDTDKMVEQASGRRIHQIFAESGESAFRRLESEAVFDALDGDRRVIAVGGGAVVDSVNRQAIVDRSLVVLLEAGVDTLIARLSRDAVEEPRPMLVSNDPKARLLALKGYRDPIYRSMASIVVSTEGLDVEQVASCIVRQAEDLLLQRDNHSRNRALRRDDETVSC